MEIFYQYRKQYNLNDCMIEFKNVKLLDINEDYYGDERKPEKFKYFKEPKLSKYPLNLNEGYERHIFRKNDVIYGKSLSQVLEFDMKMHGLYNNEKESYNIYTNRQVIINIIQSYYDNHISDYNNWYIRVNKLGNNLYMYTEYMNQNPRKKLFYSYHYKLEKILFHDSPNTEPNSDLPVDENIRLNGIYSCQLGNFNLIYSAEIQGIISDLEINDLTNMDLLNQCRFVNTKVYKNDKSWKYLYLQRYFQSYLTNVDVTYWAFIDKNGYVHDPIKPYKTKDLCKNQKWNRKINEQFIYDFLSLIVEKMAHVDSLETTYEFQYASQDRMVYNKIYQGNESFLSNNYKKFMAEKCNFAKEEQATN